MNMLDVKEKEKVHFTQRMACFGTCVLVVHHRYTFTKLSSSPCL